MQNIVSHTGNITYNLGRDVVNNSYIHNYVFAYETAHRGYRLVERQVRYVRTIWQRSATHSVTGEGNEKDQVR